MRLPALLALSGLALSAAACATVEPRSSAALTDAVSPAPLPVEGYDWMLVANEETADLAYGVPESDHLLMGLNCRRSSARIGLTTLAEHDEERVILLESGGETGRFPATAEVSELHDALIFTGETTASEPVLQRFRRVGWLAQWRDGEREAYAPHPGSAANIERFFAFCG